MARTRAKSPPRLTRDAERLIALANGLNASGSLTEDRFWEVEMSALVAKLLENGNDAPIDGALDHLYQTNLGRLRHADRAGRERERVGWSAMQGDRAWQALLVAAPDRGLVQVRDSLRARSTATTRRPCACSCRPTCSPTARARDARAVPVFDRPAAAPFLRAAPPGRAARRRGDLRRDRRKLDLARLPETANLLADTRFVVACAVVAARRAAVPLAGGRVGPRRSRGQPRAMDRAGAPHAREAAAGLRVRVPAARRVLRELPRVRPARAPLRHPRGRGLPRERAEGASAADLRAVVAGFGEERVDEYRIAFTLRRRLRGRARRRLAALRPRGRERAPRARSTRSLGAARPSAASPR